MGDNPGVSTGRFRRTRGKAARDQRGGVRSRRVGAFGRLRTGIEGLERLVGTRAGALVLFALALAAYAVRALAWPATAGRDLDEYVLAYIQLFDAHPLLPWSMLFRTPVTPIVAGVSLDLGVAETVLAVLYALSIVAWTGAARAFGRRAALVTAVALLLYQGYALMFHELSSEPVFAAAFAGLAFALARAAESPSPGRFVVVGVGVALCALVRPGNAVLLALGLFPLALFGTWRLRLQWAAGVAAAALVPLGGWTLHNGLRFDEWNVARGGNAVFPFYRAFITDHIVAPRNGNASERLADAMRRRLLTREPYRSYHVTLGELFRRGSFRVHEDLYLLSDEVFGWRSDYAILRDAGLEAVGAHPGTYARGVLTTVWEELTRAHFRVVGGEAPERRPAVRRGRLPPPGEGEPIPAGQTVWISRPDNSIRQDWTSPTAYRFVFRKPEQRPRFEEIVRRRDELLNAFPHRAPSEELARRLNQLSRWYPRPLHWLLIGLVGLALRRPRGFRLLVALPVAALLVVVLNALGLFTDLHFILPVAPAFVVFAVGALLGPRRR